MLCSACFLFSVQSGTPDLETGDGVTHIPGGPSYSSEHFLGTPSKVYEVGLLGDPRCYQIGNQNEPLPYKHILIVLMDEILSETYTWNTLCADFVHLLYI